MGFRLLTIGAFATVAVLMIAASTLLGWQPPFAAVGRALGSPVLFISALVLAVACCGGWAFVLWRTRGPDLSVPARLPVQRDPLSELGRRAAFLEDLDSVLAAHADAGRQMALHVIDIDRFAELNEVHGFDVGDTVLNAIGERLVELADQPSYVARIGSDEFVIVQTELGGAKHAQIFASRIYNTLVRDITFEGGSVSVSVAIGYAIAPEHGEQPQTLLRNADLALQAARNSGGGTATMFSSSMAPAALERKEVLKDLEGAIAHDWIEVHFQPIYDLVTNALLGFEALARINHPTKGLMFPAEFLPLAEDAGLMKAIGGVIADKAMRSAADWPETLSLSLNLSAQQLRAEGLVDAILDSAQDSDFALDRLCLEVTESLVADNNLTVGHHLKRFKEMGARLILDDFGTGASGLVHLWRHEFDAVKMDVSVVHAAPSDRRMGNLAEAIIDLAEMLEIDIIAEGTETPEQVQFLVARGCHLVQGYLFGKPVPAEDLPPIIMRDVRNRTRHDEPEAADAEAA